MNRISLIGYATSFVSFLLDIPEAEEIKNIVLFGSVARGTFSKESDIDIFVDVIKYDKKLDNVFKRQLRIFESSKINEIWKLKGIQSPITLKIGELEKWPLKRGIISDGIYLYGKYRELPKDLKQYSLIRISFTKMSRSKQVSLWRKLYGYKQKIGKKIYTFKGLVYDLQGKKLEKGIILVPIDKKTYIVSFLNKNKIKYSINEIWSDTL